MYDVLIFGGAVLYIVTPWAVFLVARLTTPRPATEGKTTLSDADNDEHQLMLVPARRGAPSDDAGRG